MVYLLQFFTSAVTTLMDTRHQAISVTSVTLDSVVAMVETSKTSIPIKTDRICTTNNSNNKISPTVS